MTFEDHAPLTSCHRHAYRSGPGRTGRAPREVRTAWCRAVGDFPGRHDLVDAQRRSHQRSYAGELRLPERPCVAHSGGIAVGDRDDSPSMTPSHSVRGRLAWPPPCAGAFPAYRGGCAPSGDFHAPRRAFRASVEWWMGCPGEGFSGSKTSCRSDVQKASLMSS